MPKAPAKTCHLNPTGEGISRRANPSKRWVFTIKNPTTEDEDNIQRVLTEDVIFTVVGREVVENGMRHLQGFVNMRTKRRLSTMRKWLSSRAHYEVAKGTDLPNDEYCTKGGDIYLSVGMPVKERRRSEVKKWGL